MSYVTGLARLPGRILWSVHMGNFSPVDWDEFKKHNQMVGHKFVIVRVCHSFADSCNLTNQANLHTPENETHIRPLCCESEAILSEMFRSVHRAGMFIWKNFHPS